MPIRDTHVKTVNHCQAYAGEMFHNLGHLPDLLDFPATMPARYSSARGHFHSVNKRSPCVMRISRATVAALKSSAGIDVPYSMHSVSQTRKP
jgi:hypothetical protein